MGKIDLKSFRKENNLSQVELAEYLGVQQGFISQIEKGDRNLPADLLDKILQNVDWDTSLLTPEQKQKDAELIAALRETISAQRETIEYQKEIIETLRMGGDSSSYKGYWYFLFPFAEVIEA